jgi:cyclic-di-GMP-binding protein
MAALCRDAATRVLKPAFGLFLQRRFPYAPAMPSFDIVSQVNSMEIENAVNQAKKELANRFDFKGSKAEIVLDKNEIKLTAEDQFKVRTLAEITIGRISKRGISMKNVENCEPDISPLGHARQVIKINQGLDAPVAKQVTGFIRDGKFKVTTQIQGSEVRVAGKSRDELQSVIAAVRAGEFPVALQFVNFRE